MESRQNPGLNMVPEETLITAVYIQLCTKCQKFRIEIYNPDLKGLYEKKWRLLLCEVCHIVKSSQVIPCSVYPKRTSDHAVLLSLFKTSVGQIILFTS